MACMVDPSQMSILVLMTSAFDTNRQARFQSTLIEVKKVLCPSRTFNCILVIFVFRRYLMGHLGSVYGHLVAIADLQSDSSVVCWRK